MSWIGDSKYTMKKNTMESETVYDKYGQYWQWVSIWKEIEFMEKGLRILVFMLIRGRHDTLYCILKVEMVL